MLRHRVILASDAVDPDVFVWINRQDMLDYAAGVWMSTHSVVDATLIEKPGTRAFVVSCLPDLVHPRFSMPFQDAVGLRLLSGNDRGRYGWAVQEDVHDLR